MGKKRKYTAGECRCPQKYAKPTICPEHGFKTKPILKGIKLYK